MISIIIPTYQHGNAIRKCLDSIFAQAYREFEVIVVDDGSTDNTAQVLKNYPEPITIIHQENRGANTARNRGFKESRGEYLLFCDADLILKLNMLQLMLWVLEQNPDKAFAYSSFKWGFKLFKLWSFDSNKLREANYIHTSSLIRRGAFPGFDENIKRLQDWDLWLTMLENGYSGIYIPEILFQVKPRKMGMSEWMPSFMYKFPWKKIGVNLKKLENYKQAEEIVRKKHNIS